MPLSFNSEAKYFKMSIKQANQIMLTILFESQQNVYTKLGVTDVYVVFLKIFFYNVFVAITLK